MPAVRPSCVALSLLVAGLVTTPATAAPLELGPGAHTRLVLDRGTVRALERAGISVLPIAGASGRRVVRLPSVGGRVDTANANGDVRHRGGVRLRRGSRVIRLTAPLVRFRATSRMRVTTRGRRFSLAYVVSRRGDVVVRGADITVTEAFLTLTSGGAAVLNRALGTRVFRRGLRLGAITVRARPRSRATLIGGRTDVTLDPGAAQELAGAGVRFGAVPPAATNPDGSIGFPIGRRSIVATGLQTGTIDHGGGIKLVKGDRALSITDPLLRLDAFPSLNSRLDYGRGRTRLLTLELAGVRSVVQQGSFAAGPIRLRLTPFAATTLNDLFGTAFLRGQLLGTATVRATT